MSVDETRIALTTDDFEATRELYASGLGLEKVDEWESPDGRGVIFAAGRATIEVLDRSQSEYVDEIETAGRDESGPVRIAFGVADVRETSEGLISHGAEAVSEVVETPWGDTNRRLRTSEGQQITVFERRGETE